MELDNENKIEVDGTKLNFVIILPYFNKNLGEELLKNTKEELLKHNVKPENIEVIRVAGTLEVPFACKKAVKNIKPDAIITLGIVIRGETSHYDLVTNTAYQGIMNVQLESDTPIAFGILACENVKQAKHRVSKKGLNKGMQAAQAALIQTTL